MKRTSWLPIALACALLLAGCAGDGAGPSPTSFPTLPALDTPTAYVFRLQTTAEPTPSPASSPTVEARRSIPVDGELASTYPPLKVTYPSGVSGKLLALHVRLGQVVRAGDPIATLDEGDLVQAVAGAQLALERAIEDRSATEGEAEAAYQRALEEAGWELELAQAELRWTRLRTPDAAMLQAEISLENAREAEAFAAEAWKQSLDRPWEPQWVRDAALREYNKKSKALELTELLYQRAQVELDVYSTQLMVRQKAVVRAQVRLAAVEKETCEACERAVADAESTLAEARERLGHTELRAPQDGMVTAIDAYAGSVVTGETAIVTLLAVDDLVFTTLNLDERHAALVRPGQRAAIILRFYPEATIVGEVHALFPRLGDGEGARFVAHIRLVETGGLSLLPGMTGRAEIALE